MRFNKVFSVLILVFSFLISSSVLAAIDKTAEWATSVADASNASTFNSVAVDSSGNVYAAGYIFGTGDVDFGNGVIVKGTYALSINVVLVKYDRDGNALWAKSLSSGSDSSEFKSVSVGPDGNVYAAGFVFGSGEFNFGGTATVNGGFNGFNAVLVKYDSDGNAQWARSVTTPPESSQFNSVSVDSVGNVYAAGYIGSGEFNFGTIAEPATVTGVFDGINVVLVKYDTGGNAQWAKSVAAGASNASTFNSVAVDSLGNVYAAGNVFGSGLFDFGSASAKVLNGYASGVNVVLVKYNSSGVAQWARSVTTPPESSQFNSVAVDSSDNVYAAGYVIGSGEFNFGTIAKPVTVKGEFIGSNIVLVKYDGSNGDAQWAKSVTAGPNDSEFKSVSVDSSGNVYAAGWVNGDKTFDFGAGVKTAGTVSESSIVLVTYDSNGNAQWAKSVTVGPNKSLYNSVSVDSSGNVYAAGEVWGTGTFDFGAGVTAAGTHFDNNIVLVKYSNFGPSGGLGTLTGASNIAGILGGFGVVGALIATAYIIDEFGIGKK